MSAAAAPSSRRIEANRRNAQKSTGPKSPEGKDRVRLNALKHGLTAATVVLPGEDAGALQARVEAWKEDLRPATAVEGYLVERAAHVSWQLDRADRTIAARLAARVDREPLDRPEHEAERVAELSRRLFWDPMGPIALYPHVRPETRLYRVSWSCDPDRPTTPAQIVGRLEGLEAGCRWLLDRWADLRTILEDGRRWQPPDRLRAVRLLGRQPMDALEDDRVLSIYMACRAMDPDGPPPIADLATEMWEEEWRVFAERVRAREDEARWPKDPAAGRAALLAIADRAMARIEAMLERHVACHSHEAPGRLDALAFDDTAEGERLRRYQIASGRALHQSLNAVFKVRRETADREPQDGGGAPEDAPLAASSEPPPVASETNPAPAAASPAATGSPSHAAPEIPSPAEAPHQVPTPAEAEPAIPPPTVSRLGEESPSEEAEPAPGPTGETNPNPGHRPSIPTLDPCSEGRIMERLIEDPEPLIRFLEAAAAPLDKKAGQRRAPRPIPPGLRRLLGELVRQKVVEGSARIPGLAPARTADPP